MALWQAQPERALQLAGAAGALRQVMEFVLPPVEQKRFDQICATARQELGSATATVAWATGAAMTLDEAVAYALAG